MSPRFRLTVQEKLVEFRHQIEAVRANFATVTAVSNIIAKPLPFSVEDVANCTRSASMAESILKFVSRELSELGNISNSVYDMIIDPWLPAPEAAMIYARRGTGKSMFALSIAMAVAAGVDLAGWRIPKARRLVYIDGEMSVFDL